MAVLILVLVFQWRVTGADLMEVHLREIRGLHRRLEDSIQTNERLRQQLAERLDSKIQDGGLRITLTINSTSYCSLFQTSKEMIINLNWFTFILIISWFFTLLLINMNTLFINIYYL